MASEEARVAGFEAISFWQDLCPELHCCEKQDYLDAQRVEPVEDAQAGFALNGYCRGRLSPANVIEAKMEVLAICAQRLQFLGLHPNFLLMYDEAWNLHMALLEFVRAHVHSTMMPLLDAMVFLTQPGGRGWTIHRDRPEAARDLAFRSDGSPRYVTTWLAVTDAPESNSCLYCLPRYEDPNFDHDVDDEVDEAGIEGKALPCFHGDLICFSGRLLHWGGRSSTDKCRVAISFAFSDPQSEESIILSKVSEEETSSNTFAALSFDARLALCCAQLLRYSGNISLPPQLSRLCTCHMLARQSLFQCQEMLSFILKDATWQSLLQDPLCNRVSKHAGKVKAFNNADAGLWSALCSVLDDEALLALDAEGEATSMLQSSDGSRIAVLSRESLQLCEWNDETGWQELVEIAYGNTSLAPSC